MNKDDIKNITNLVRFFCYKKFFGLTNLWCQYYAASIDDILQEILCSCVKRPLTSEIPLSLQIRQRILTVFFRRNIYIIYGKKQETYFMEDDYVEFQVEIQKLLNGLHKTHREILELKFFKNQTDQQIAKKFGVTKQAINQRIKRILSRLSEYEIDYFVNYKYDSVTIETYFNCNFRYKKNARQNPENSNAN